MKIQPKKTRFKKFPKGKSLHRINPKIYNYYSSIKSTVMLKAITPCRLSGVQLESLYNHLNKFLKKNGVICIQVFPHIPNTRRPDTIRMGKGKGPIHNWICQILPGTSFCEIETNNITKVLKAVKYAKMRLPFKTKIVLL